MPFRALRCRLVWVYKLCVGVWIWFGELFVVYGLLAVWTVVGERGFVGLWFPSGLVGVELAVFGGFGLLTCGILDVLAVFLWFSFWCGFGGRWIWWWVLFSSGLGWGWV